MLDTGFLAWLFAGAIVSGVLGSMLGLGGGVFLVPLLTLGLHLPIHFAIGTSIVAVVATSSAAAGVYTLSGLTNLRLGMILEIATTIGAITGGLTAALVSRQTLNILFALVLLYTAGSMLVNRKRPESFSEAAVAWTPGEEQECLKLSAAFYDEAARREVRYQVRHLPLGAFVSFLAGNLSGLLGIGGGIIKVPTMNLVMGIPIKAAAATSNFMVGVTAATSAFVYYSRGYINPFYAAPAAIGIFLGAQAGSRLAKKTRSKILVKLFAFLSIYLAVRMLWEGISAGIGGISFGFN
ncbi:MAG: sulfite exporter TauE/SafE family protein [Syntrophothermus sp.]